MSERISVRTEIEVGGQPLRVLSCSIEEAISAIPLLEAEVTTPEGAPDPGTLLGKPLRCTLRRSDDSRSRSFAGLVIEATRSADKDGTPSVVLRAAPRLWRLGKRADCRTFQKKSVPDIVKEVLTGAGIPAGDQETHLTGSYEPRVYAVQYRESDLDFVTRLLSEEGIYFVVRHEDGQDRVVFSDGPAGLGAIEGTSSLPFAHAFGFDTSREHVMWVEQALEVRPDKVFVRDYDFERPKFKLEAKGEGKDDGPKALEVYRYPGRSASGGTLARYAQVLLDSMQAERDVVRGEATVLTLEPGATFTLTDHPYEPLNQEYLITSIRIGTTERRMFDGAAEQTGRDYACRFTAVPTARSPYRPPRIARARAIPGAQTAVTTGPAGGEIHTDNHGRVKAKYHWDRLGKSDDTSSVWMRTSQVPTGGSMLLPRVGWEVTVRHIEGDPDQPVVMSRVYTATAPPPYPLPAGKTRGALQTATTPGGGSSNELRMDDTKGKEEMFFNASKDMTVDVVNNTTESITSNETRTIGSNRKLNVTNSVTTSVGAAQKISVGGNQSVKVETFLVEQCGADHSLSIGGNRDLKIGGDHKRTVDGASTESIGGRRMDLVVGSVNETTMANMTHSVSTALAEITAGDRSVLVGGDRTESTGAVKAVIAAGGRGVDVTGSMTTKVAGAILTMIGGDRNDNAEGLFTEVAAGAQIVKANSVTLEGDAVVSLVMGASTITLTPASISIAGVSIKIDGATAELAALILDN